VTLFQVSAQEYVQIKPKKGDGIYFLLRKYRLNNDSLYLKKFIEINNKKTNANAEIFTHFNYSLPIRIMKFDGKTIRSSLGITNYELAKEIQDYNINIVNDGIKKSNSKSIEFFGFHFIFSK